MAMIQQPQPWEMALLRFFGRFRTALARLVSWQRHRE